MQKKKRKKEIYALFFFPFFCVNLSSSANDRSKTALTQGECGSQSRSQSAALALKYKTWITKHCRQEDTRRLNEAPLCTNGRRRKQQLRPERIHPPSSHDQSDCLRSFQPHSYPRSSVLHDALTVDHRRHPSAVSRAAKASCNICASIPLPDTSPAVHYADNRIFYQDLSPRQPTWFGGRLSLIL